MSQYDSDPFNTDEATEGGYSSLEERILANSIDNESCVYDQTRLRGWQKSLLNMVGDNVGTNQVTVFYHAFTAGASDVRDLIGADNITEVRELRQSLRNLAKYQHISEDHPDMFNNISDVTIDDPNRDQGEIQETFRIKAKDSIISEVKKYLEGGAEFDPWIKREVIAIGLGHSDDSEMLYEQYVEESKDAVESAHKRSRTIFEKRLRNMIGDEVEFWIQNGIMEGQLNLIEEAVGMMETKHKRPAMNNLKDIRQEAEVIPEGEGGQGD